MGKIKSKKHKENKIKPKNFAENHKVLKELEMLFDMAPPSFLKKSIMEIFFSYLCNTELQEYKPEIKEIATDFYFLLKFLEIAEMYEKEKAT